MSSHVLCVLGKATPSDLNVVNPSALCPIDHLRVTTYPLTPSLDGAWCFDRPSQGGTWYTCPVVIVRYSLDVYKPWWDRAGDIVVWGQIGASPDISDTSMYWGVNFFFNIKKVNKNIYIYIYKNIYIPQYMDWGIGGLGDISHHR